MKRVEIAHNIVYLETENDIEMYEYLDDFVNKCGYEINGGHALCVDLVKDDNHVILSHYPIDSFDLTNMDELLKQEVLYPDYNDTFINTIAAIRKNFGYDHIYESNTDIFDKYYNKVVILLLDGLGTSVMEECLDENSFIRSCYKYSQHSIFPSTTAAATTSFKAGLPPIRTGWTGWENYIREMNRNIVLFTGVNYYTDEPTGRCGYDFMPCKPFYHDMDVFGYIIEPDFSKEHKIDDVLNKSSKINKKCEKQIQYVYYTEPDSCMHEYGCDSKEAKEVLKKLDIKVRKYAENLTNDTILIITADHGHINVKPINLYACKTIIDLLNRKPSNDGRCITFSVKDGKHKEFEHIFRSLYSSIYKLYTKEEAINLGFFGLPNDIRHPRIDDFLGDYVAVAISNYYFNYKGPDNFVFKSHHAGITKREMLVPICVYKK